MAKAKKKKMTLEEALVPVEEQPYKVPENWCWTRIKYISDVVTGNTPSKKHPEFYGGDFPLFKPADLDADYYICEASEYLSEEGKNVARKIPPLSTAVCCIGTIGKTALLGTYGTTNQQINSIIPKINPIYVYYYSKTDNFIRELWDKSTATTISLVNKNNMETNHIPLAPVAEQQRIVDQIESLFSKLDEAKEKAQEALESFETRKDAILYKAFTGKLSEKWRNEKNIVEECEKTILSNVLDVRDGTHDSPQYYKTGYPLVTSKNLKNGTITDKDLNYISKEDYDQINQRSKVDVGDILFAMIGTIGNPVVVTDEPNYAIKNMALLKNIGKVNSYYVRYYLESREVRDKMMKDARGSTQKFVSLGYLREFPIKLPTNDEQKYIVGRLDELLHKEYQVKETIESIICGIDFTKKSILSKAFRGELGTNNPKDESSLELLKRILE